MRKFVKVALGATMAFGLATASQAAVTLGVSMTVASSCTVTGGTLTFTGYDHTTNTDNTGSVTATCVVGTAYHVMLDAGANPSTVGDVTTRRMKNSSGSYVAYQLYKDSNHTQVFGNTQGTNSYDATAAVGTGETVNVYGRIPSSATAAPVGIYNDTVGVTINY
jgi:spore coat protein U-like protein